MFAERQRLSPSPVGIEVSRLTLHFGVVDQSALPIGSIVGFPNGAPWIHHSAVTITTAAESHSDVTKYSQNSGRLWIPSAIGKTGKMIFVPLARVPLRPSGASIPVLDEVAPLCGQNGFCQEENETQGKDCHEQLFRNRPHWHRAREHKSADCENQTGGRQDSLTSPVKAAMVV